MQAAGRLVGCGKRVWRSYLSSCVSVFFQYLCVCLLSFTYLVSFHVMPCFFFFLNAVNIPAHGGYVARFVMQSRIQPNAGK